MRLFQKSLSRFILALIFVFSLSTNLFSEENKIVKVGFFNLKGYHDIDENNDYRGYGYDVLQKMASYNDWIYKYVGYEKSWADMFDLLDSGEIDLLSFAQKTPERLAKYDFSESPIGSDGVVIIVRDGETRYVHGDYSTFNGMKIGGIKGSSKYDSFRKFASERNISYTPFFYKDQNELEKALCETKEVDAILVSSISVKQNYTVLEQIESTDFYIIVNKGNQELLTEINTALKTMDSIEPLWRGDLWQDHFSFNFQNKLILTSEEENYLKNEASKNLYTVLVKPDRNPYVIKRNGTFQGIYPDIFNMVAKRIGLNFSYINVKSAEEYREVLAKGEADIIIDFPMNYSNAEKFGYKLTHNYLSVSVMKVFRRDSDMNPVIGIDDESFLYRMYNDILDNEGKIRSYHSYDECSNAILHGECDVTYLYNFQAQRTLNLDMKNVLTIDYFPDYVAKPCFAVSNRVSHELVSILNKSVLSINSAEINEITNRYLVDLRPPVSLIGYIYRNPLSAIILICIIAVVALGVFTIYIMQKKEQTKILQKNQIIIENALHSAEEANKAKTLFLNNMSHDIRTPMNAIIGFTSLAAVHLDDKVQVKDYLNKISVSSNHLLSLINDILDMSRIESGRTKLNETQIYLPDILHDLRTIISPSIVAKKIEFFIDIQNVTHEDVYIDELRLNQILFNIIGNAVKFTNPGGKIHLMIRESKNSKPDYTNFDIQVRDTGIGMSEEFLKHVFEAFERERTSTVSKIQGTGLGLSITKHIVDLMGGTIEVESEVGKGSVFTVHLPVKIAEPLRKYDVSQLAGKRALVVDQSAEVCSNVDKMLKSIGMRSEWTTSSNEAIEKTKIAEKNNNSYEAYIIDWAMPDINGIEVVRRIRKLIGDSKPIIVLTAFDWTEIESEARAAGVTDFCAKPLFMSELKSVLVNPTIDETVDTLSGKIDLSGKKILVVEDNELNKEIAVTILEEVGATVDVAENGEIAVDKVSTYSANTYDLILMDIQMPVMDGIEATRAIRNLNDKAKADIPIIAMTANVFDEDKEIVRKVGMNGHISKPVNIQELFDTLSNFLKVK